MGATSTRKLPNTSLEPGLQLSLIPNFVSGLPRGWANPASGSVQAEHFEALFPPPLESKAPHFLVFGVV